MDLTFTWEYDTAFTHRQDSHILTVLVSIVQLENVSWYSGRLQLKYDVQFAPIHLLLVQGVELLVLLFRKPVLPVPDLS